jgi:hypothetical protein
MIKRSTWSAVIIAVVGVLAWLFAMAVTMPDSRNDPNSIYELTRQTALNTRQTFMLLSMVVAMVVAYRVCLQDEKAQNRTDAYRTTSEDIARRTGKEQIPGNHTWNLWANKERDNE